MALIASPDVELIGHTIVLAAFDPAAGCRTRAKLAGLGREWRADAGPGGR